MTRRKTPSPQCDSSLDRAEDINTVAPCTVDDNDGEDSPDGLPIELKSGEFEKLSSLNLSNSNLTVFPEWVARRLISLDELDLSSNRLREVPNSLIEAKRLRKLNLSSNELTAVPCCIVNGLHLLQELNFSDNYISCFPKPASVLVLRSLKCALNMLPCFPPWLFLMDYYNFEELDLSENYLFKETLPSLAYFPIGFKRIIRRLVLRNVGLDDSNLFVLACFSGIEELDISQMEEKVDNYLCGTANKITQLDSLVKFVPRLKSLTAQRLSLKPPNFDVWPRLERLDMSQNWFMGFDVLSSSPALCLVELRVSSCDILKIPSNIGEFKLLKILDLSRNLICDVPPSLYSLTNLEYLDLYHNYLGISPNFENFPNLKALDVCGNDFLPAPHPLGENGPSYDELRDNLRQMGGKQLRLVGRRCMPPEIISDSSDGTSDEEKAVSYTPPENSLTKNLEIEEEIWNVETEDAVDDNDFFDPRDCKIVPSPDVYFMENPNIIRDRCPTKVKSSANFHVPWSFIYVPKTTVKNWGDFEKRTFAEGQFDDA